MALDRADGIEVAVLNSKLVHRFAQTLRRSKTDSADAQALAEYSRRMPFTPWRAPSLNSLQLQLISRHLLGLTAEYTSAKQPPPRRGEISGDAALRVNDRSALWLRSSGASCGSAARRENWFAAMKRSGSGPMLLYRRIPGIAEISAVQLLGELSSLSPEMSVRSGGCGWTRYISPGTSVHKPSRMSRAGNRYLRRALYMPAPGCRSSRSPPEGVLRNTPESSQGQAAGDHRRRSQAAPCHLRDACSGNTLRRKQTSFPRSCPPSSLVKKRNIPSGHPLKRKCRSARENLPTLWKSLRDSHIPTASTTGYRCLLVPPQLEALLPQGACNGCLRSTA